jgi:hypothetical protein
LSVTRRRTNNGLDNTGRADSLLTIRLELR